MHIDRELENNPEKVADFNLAYKKVISIGDLILQLANKFL